jgi:hypothetical protein
LDIERIKSLIEQRQAIDTELVAIVNGAAKRKPQVCGKCGEHGHSARTCTKPDA